MWQPGAHFKFLLLFSKSLYTLLNILPVRLCRGQKAAQELDEDLMGPLGFSIDQLMELAGLSVASAVIEEYSPSAFSRVLILAGPGNNGGDGLVAARHLHHFGYSVEVCYPKRTELYRNLVIQCTALGIPFIPVEEVLEAPLKSRADIVLDALFGFSFKGMPRPPFDGLISAMTPSSTPPVVIAVDIPSGWDVESGDVSNSGLSPDMLVSLTTPKQCARSFNGPHHYLGGRFVPPEIISKYGLVLPRYPGASQCVRLGGPTGANPAAAAASVVAASVADMRLSYAVGELEETHAASDPWTQFSEWFTDAKNAGFLEPNAMAVASATPDATPSLRYVLMKGFGPRGVTFFTNYNSRKGGELEANPQVAATFWWDRLERSVRFEGVIERLPAEESDEYWNSRPWGHQVGGLASTQSSVVSGGRKELEERLAAAEAGHPESEGPVPRPVHWGGYLIKPKVIEFWQGRKSRFHDRLRYTRVEGGKWEIERLAP